MRATFAIKFIDFSSPLFYIFSRTDAVKSNLSNNAVKTNSSNKLNKNRTFSVTDNTQQITT